MTLRFLLNTWRFFGPELNFFAKVMAKAFIKWRFLDDKIDRAGNFCFTIRYQWSPGLVDLWLGPAFVTNQETVLFSLG